MKSTIYRLRKWDYNAWAMAALLAWTLADVVIKLREDRDWTQRELAKKAGVGDSTVARLEQGEEMKDESLRKVAAAFGLTRADLDDLVPPAATREVMEGTRIWKKLGPDSRVKVLEILRQYDPAQSEADPLRVPQSPVEREGKGAGSDRGKIRA